MGQCKNTNSCTCTYSSCDKYGVCCDCVVYHRDRGEIPGCFFSKDVEKTYDRSIKNFIRNNSN